MCNEGYGMEEGRKGKEKEKEKAKKLKKNKNKRRNVQER